MAEKEQRQRKTEYKALEKFIKEMLDAVDEQVEKAILYQKRGEYKIPEKELYKYKSLDYELFAEMLAERDEVNMAGYDSGDESIRLWLAPKFVYTEDDGHLKVITQKEFEMTCAKHLLWLESGIGEQADFSNCLLRNLELSDRWLENIIFDNAKIVDSRMNGANCNSSSFKGTRIIKTECIEMTAQGADFTGAKISNCVLSNADMSSSNFTKAAFWDCDFFDTVLRESCLEKTKFHRTDIVNCDTTDCVYDEQEWETERNGLKMGG